MPDRFLSRLNNLWRIQDIIFFWLCQTVDVMLALPTLMAPSFTAVFAALGRIDCLRRRVERALHDIEGAAWSVNLACLVQLAVRQWGCCGTFELRTTSL
jgi:hypothetical protein